MKKYIDLHCHSCLKPYSKSFKVSSQGGQNSTNTKRAHSIWHQKKPNFLDKVANSILSVTKFTQADFTTSYDGDVGLIIVSIDPMEKELILSKRRKPQTFLGRILKNFIIGIGLPRIAFLTNDLKDDYYSDLLKTKRYMEQLNNDVLNTKKYKILTEMPEGDLDEDTLHIIYSIEGGHVFNTNLPGVMDRVEDIKTWEAPPCWISLAHHFRNGLCGQAQSFKGFFPELAYKQYLDPALGLTNLGEEVARKLLEQSGNSRRILIDVKHMNLKARNKYYEIADELQVPIVVSHGALTFRNSDTHDTEINFYNDELIKIAKSGGVFGVQLDARRLKYVKDLPTESEPPKFDRNRAFRKEWKRVTGQRFKKKRYKRAYYIWKQISHFAELLDQDPGFEGRIWDFQCIGSDFDGIVDPLDGFWTHNQFDNMLHYIRLNVQQYILQGRYNSLKPNNQKTEDEIIDGFIYKNAERFFREHYARN